MMLNAAETAVFTVGRCAYVLHVMQWSVEISEQYLVICSILGVIYSTSAVVCSIQALDKFQLAHSVLWSLCRLTSEFLVNSGWDWLAISFEECNNYLHIISATSFLWWLNHEPAMCYLLHIVLEDYCHCVVIDGWRLLCKEVSGDWWKHCTFLGCS